MMLYDFRIENQFSFSAEEIAGDSVLKFVAERMGVEEGVIKIDAASAEGAFKGFFGVDPEDACSLPDDQCPPMEEGYNGYHSNFDGYSITPESSW